MSGEESETNKKERERGIRGNQIIEKCFRPIAVATPPTHVLLNVN